MEEPEPQELELLHDLGGESGAEESRLKEQEDLLHVLISVRCFSIGGTRPSSSETWKPAACNGEDVKQIEIPPLSGRTESWGRREALVMEELRPQDTKDPMRELEEEYGTHESSSQDVVDSSRGVEKARAAGRRIFRLLAILAVGVVVIVGVFYACTWLVVAQPTVGKLSLTTVAVAVVVMIGFVLLIMQYLGLLAEIVSFISKRIRKP